MSFIVLTANAQCTFERYYKFYAPTNWNTKTIHTSDGGFLTVGSMYVDSLNPGQNGYPYMCAVKNDSCGNILWKNIYGPSENGDVVEADNGDYLMTNTGPGPAIANIEVVRIDKNGQLLWDKIYTGNIQSFAYHIIKRKNKNSYIVSGSNVYGYAMEINDTGNVLRGYSYVYGGLTKVLETTDSTYLMVGGTHDTLFLIQTDTSFNVKGVKKIFFNFITPYIIFYDACISSDNKSIVMTLCVGGNLMVKVALDGSFITYKTLAKSFPDPICIIPTPDNGYLVGSALLYTDSNFNITKYQNVSNTILGSFVLNQNQSVTASGINVRSGQYYELCVLRINTNGSYAHSGINEAKTATTNWIIYPNPAANELHIETTGSEKFGVQLFDITGKKVMENILFTNTTTINTSSLNEGMYFVRITDVNGAIIKTQKVTVMR